MAKKPSITVAQLLKEKQARLRAVDPKLGTNKAVAQILGCDAATYGRWLKGTSVPDHARLVRKIAEWLDWPIDRIHNLIERERYAKTHRSTDDGTDSAR